MGTGPPRSVGRNRRNKELTNSMRRRCTLLAGVAALLVLAGGCTPGQPAVSANERVAAEDRTEAAAGGGGEAPAPGGPVIAFAAGNQIAWSDAPTEAPAGPVTVELTCEGLAHNVLIEGVNGDEPVVECAAAGTFTGSAELEAGSYAYHCDIPGHEAAMSGEMTVS